MRRRYARTGRWWGLPGLGLPVAPAAGHGALAVGFVLEDRELALGPAVDEEVERMLEEWRRENAEALAVLLLSWNFSKIKSFL